MHQTNFAHRFELGDEIIVAINPGAQLARGKIKKIQFNYPLFGTGEGNLYSVDGKNFYYEKHCRLVGALDRAKTLLDKEIDWHTKNDNYPPDLVALNQVRSLLEEVGK